MYLKCVWETRNAPRKFPRQMYKRGDGGNLISKVVPHNVIFMYSSLIFNTKNLLDRIVCDTQIENSPDVCPNYLW